MMNNRFIKPVLTATITLMLTCCITYNGNAQLRDSLLRVYNNETIHSFGKFYVVGSRQLTFGDLKSQFTTGITKDLYKKAKGKLMLGRLFTVTAVAALVTGAIIKKNNNGAAIALSFAGISLNLGSFHLRKKSSEFTDQAIWYRNKEILFGNTP